MDLIKTYFKPTVNTTIHTDSDRQKKNGQYTIAARVRYEKQTNCWSKLSDSIKNFSSRRDTKLISGDEPISNH